MPKKTWLYEVDLLRACMILGVVCVHNMSFLNLFTVQHAPDNVVYEALLAAFHFTRESFMFITGLVLFITYYRRDFRAGSFWLRRLTLIFIPYVAWTIIYVLFSGTYEHSFQWTIGNLAHTIGQSLLFGQQFFLYYLLISIQLYIVFPVFVKFMRKTERWHVWILIASFALEIVIMWWNQVYLQNLVPAHYSWWLHLLLQYRDRNLLTYQFWFVAGAVAAVHYEALKQFIRKHGRLVFALLLLTLAALWVHFYLQRVVFQDTETVVDLVLQPLMIPYSAAVTLALLAVGIRWADTRERPRMRVVSPFIQLVANASFGVFLVHPLCLHFAEVAFYKLHLHAAVREWLTPVSILSVYLASIVVARLIGMVPLLGYIVGQKADWPKARAVSASPTS